MSLGSESLRICSCGEILETGDIIPFIFNEACFLPWEPVGECGLLSSVSRSEGNIHIVCDSSLNWVQFIASRMGVYIVWTERNTDGSDPEQLHYLCNVDDMINISASTLA